MGFFDLFKGQKGILSTLSDEQCEFLNFINKKGVDKYTTNKYPNATKQVKIMVNNGFLREATSSELLNKYYKVNDLKQQFTTLSP